MRGFFKFIFSKLFVCILLIAAYVCGIIFICMLLPAVLSLGAAVIGAFILTAVAAVKAAAGDYPAEFRCAWLLTIAALPVLGAAAYFITMYRPRPAENTHCRNGLTGYRSCRYFGDGPQFFDALCEAADGATKRIYIEFYILAEGKTFDRLCAVLERALARGVEVKVMTDALGSALRLPKRQLKKLKMQGAEIKIFNRLVPPPLSRLNFRDHRKIAAIDGEVALCGGMNIADEYANLTRPHGQWKDCAFMVTGGAALFFEGLFLAAWRGGDVPAPRPPAKGERAMLPVFDSPPASRGRASELLCREIARADRRVWIFTPYLCPDERIFAAIADAACRGVDVKILLPAIPDKKSAYAITRDCAARLKARGADIYAYTPGFIHAKAVICDGRCLLGSYNLDCRSLWLNHECGALFTGEMVESAARDFEACLALSERFNARRQKLAKLFSPLA